MVIKSGTTSVEYDDILACRDEELIFEEPDGWYLTYDLRISDNMIEYSQSSGRGEIVGSCIRTVGSGEVEMNFTDDGKKNKQKVCGFRNEFPSYVSPSRKYEKLIKKA